MSATAGKSTRGSCSWGRLGLLVGLLCIAQLGALSAATARSGVTVVLAGGGGLAEIGISLSADGRSYLISASGTLEGGGGVCSNPAGEPNRLECRARAVAAFRFNGGPGGNTAIVARNVPAPVVLRGGGGEDLLIGGGGGDLLIGGRGEDVLIGGPGDDRLHGGPGDDLLIGGRGSDVCNGTAGRNAAVGCAAIKNVAVVCQSVRDLRAAAGSSPCARWARTHPGAIARLASLPGRPSRPAWLRP